ncbi:YvrJ family protein [Saccharibacillus qingshengii]|uniref:YvrJ family protein n=1 Tax=Saccharibacillus qingshengii TaxID=1763540 RepID=UPI00155767C7|nr:YvrJ family protein [Saccharibacillus qingshengii]
MSQPDLIGLIANLGFPIAITAYLLLRFEKKITDLSRTIGSLKEEIQKRVK